MGRLKPEAAQALIERLRADPALVVGDNEPYDGALRGDTMHRHCSTTGLAHGLIEVRQDLICDDAGVEAWINRLAPILSEVTGLPEMHEIELHGSRVV